MADNVLVLLPDMYKFAIAVNDPKMMAMRLTFYLPRTEDSPSKKLLTLTGFAFRLFFCCCFCHGSFFFFIFPTHSR